jgi:hypothetical protein
VLRNVSAFGPIDLVAVKKGEVLLLDVKSDTSGVASITEEQADLGVKLLIVEVSKEDRCRCHIEHQPIVQGRPVRQICRQCGEPFHYTPALAGHVRPGNVRPRFCPRCRPGHPSRRRSIHKTIIEHSLTSVLEPDHNLTVVPTVSE